MKITKDYVAGYLENVGSFHLIRVNNRKTKHPIFKMVMLRKLKNKVKLLEMILEFLKKNYGIVFKCWENSERLVYQLNRYEMVKKLLKFFEENCYTKSLNQNKVIYYIKRKEGKI